jgi:hypothetical protein
LALIGKNFAHINKILPKDERLTYFVLFLSSPQQTSPYNSITPTTGYAAYAPTTPVATTPVTPIQPQSSTPPLDSLDPVPVQRLNEIFISKQEQVIERMESESNWIGIYAQ